MRNKFYGFETLLNKHNEKYDIYFQIVDSPLMKINLENCSFLNNDWVMIKDSTVNRIQLVNLHYIVKVLFSPKDD